MTKFAHSQNETVVNGLIGTKLGMTSIFDEAGKNVACTVIELGPNVVTQVKTEETDGYSALQLAYGEFLAFYQKDTDAATKFLRKSMKLNISDFQEATVKLLLADILVLQEKFNEALIYFSQIQKSLKNSTLSQEARFKVAKTSYYKGDFEWAETQLKVLKSSTSQLIANDALDLKLLISILDYLFRIQISFLLSILNFQI